VTRRDTTATILGGVIAAWVAIHLAECVGECGGAWGEARPRTAVAVARLAPHLSAARAREIGGAIDAAASAAGLDPVLVAAIAARESSFRPSVLDGTVRGARGEVGIMQVLPGGAALRHAPSGCDQTELACSLATGCGYLAWLRDEGCPGSQWRWVAAYGRRRCPSEAEARQDAATLRARDYYRRVGGAAWRE